MKCKYDVSAQQHSYCTGGKVERKTIVKIYRYRQEGYEWRRRMFSVVAQSDSTGCP